MEYTKTNYNGPVIYILTNPAFPELVKIGYTTNVDERLKNWIIAKDYHILLDYTHTKKLIKVYLILNCITLLIN